ncbi:MAG TPA: M20 family metallopeptidase [Acidimicrobiales bacterium]
MDVEVLKQRVCDEIDRRAPELVRISHEIHAHPELNFDEHFAHDLLASALEAEGLPTQRSAHGVATAFRAEAGAEGHRVAILCEYDALPGLGHACGHNIIAAAGLGAGLALAAVAREARGRVTILGTPAEEGGGGKIVLAETGAFADIDAAMMVHPADADLRWMGSLALHELDVWYQGQAAHAAAFPWEGRNALDAAVIGYTAVAALRQHIRPGERVHGVFTDGGEKANIVPRRASMQWLVRSPTVAGLEALKQRVVACLQAGADATGCTMGLKWSDVRYTEIRDNEPMVAAYVANAARLGRAVADPRDGQSVVASTDMGNVSYLVPSIHPMIQVAPPGTPIHTPAFEGHAASPAGDRAVIDGAKALAMTAVDLWNGDLLARAREAFAQAG